MGGELDRIGNNPQLNPRAPRAGRRLATKTKRVRSEVPVSDRTVPNTRSDLTLN